MTIFPIRQPVLVAVGPTAVGKTSLSLRIAEEFGCEIISLDSVQVYRYMDIGSAKATPEERRRVPHHLIDIVDPDELYDASMYETDGLRAINDIHSRGKIPFITGGTGLYLRALIEGLFEKGGSFPQIRKQLKDRLAKEGSSKLHEQLAEVDRFMAQKIHPNDTHRLLRALEIYLGTGKPWSDHIASQPQAQEQRFTNVCTIGLACDRQQLYERINRRTTVMLESGLKEEVAELFARGYHRELKPMQSIGYRHMAEHLLDGRPWEDMERLLARDTRRYAKRQFTWFKRMNLDWIDVDDVGDIKGIIKRFLNHGPQ